jgi:hypothetical protein
VQRVKSDIDDGLKGAVEVLITEVFGETERSLSKVRSSMHCQHMRAPRSYGHLRETVLVRLGSVKWLYCRAPQGSAACQLYSVLCCILKHAISI